MSARKYEFDVWMIRPSFMQKLDVKSISVSVDLDRVPYVEARFQVSGNADPDPRDNTDRIRWRVIEYDQAGAVVRQLPATGYSVLVLQEATRDVFGTGWELMAQSFECLLDEKKRVATTEVTLSIANVLAACQYAATDAAVSYADFPTVITDAASSSAALIPAGDRRVWRQGEPLSAIYESEVAGSGRRFRSSIYGNDLLLEYDTRDPFAAVTPVILRTPDAPGVIDGYEAPILRGREITSRADWADAVLVQYQYTNSSGTVVTGWQPPSGGGANTKAKVVRVGKPNPGIAAADGMTARAKMRGRRYELTTRAHFLAQPRMPASVRIRSEPMKPAVITAVQWDMPAGTMTVRAELDS